MADLISFATHPFTIFWTLGLIGLLMALPDRLTREVTTRDNLGAFVIVVGGLILLVFGGIVNFDAIRQSGPLANIFRYVLHPLTVGWTIILIGTIIALPDRYTDQLLSQDKLGIYLIVAAAIGLVFGIGLLRLDQLISPQLVIGIVIGAALRHFLPMIYAHRDEFVVPRPPTPTTPRASIRVEPVPNEEPVEAEFTDVDPDVEPVIEVEDPELPERPPQ